MTDPNTKVLASYINALADLAQPKASILLLHDQARLYAYQTAIAGALQELPGDPLLTSVLHPQGSRAAFCPYEVLFIADDDLGATESPASRVDLPMTWYCCEASTTGSIWQSGHFASDSAVTVDLFAMQLYCTSKCLLVTSLRHAYITYGGRR